jgi:UDP-glucuronate decarboxylase
MIRVMATGDEFIGPINLGNPDPITMLQLAQEIISLTKSKSEIIFQDLPSDDPKDRRPDISKAKTLLGWEPKVDRVSGLERTISYVLAENY